MRTVGLKLPLPKARYKAPEPWKDADQKQLLQFLKTPSGTKFLLTLHDVAAGRALETEVDRLEKLTGKAAKPPAASGGGDKKLTAD